MEQGYDQKPTGVATEPHPTGVATEDYWLPFTVPHGLMPDRQFDGRPASLHVHRVRPVYAPGHRPKVRQAVVLIHGRTVTGPVAFDLRDPLPATGGGALNLSVQNALALKGIDTFAPSLLGYGRSTRFDEGLNDPGNASRRAYPANPDSPCQFPEGCDRTLIPGINPLNQQDLLLPEGPNLPGNPLFFRRTHSSNFHFARTDVWVRDIDQVIDDAIERARPTARKVALVGYSVGGHHVGRTLYADNPNELLDERDKVIEKVSRVVFLNSFFGVGVAGSGPTEETDPLGLPTFPLTLDDFDATKTLWQVPASPLPRPDCPGRIIPGTQEQVWNQIMEHDSMGRVWGKTRGPTGGLNRSPTFSGYGWNIDVARKLSKPTLVMQGLEDGVLPTGPGTGEIIYNNLQAVENKVLVQVECASHVLQWEGCAGADCTPHYATFQKALIDWIKEGKFNGQPKGSFKVNQRGDVSTA
jgi:pimeloyl-ACP methyl ester carboxylesterase